MPKQYQVVFGVMLVVTTLFGLIGSALYGFSVSVLAILVTNRLACGAWKTTPWGDLW